ncbi:MAG: Crp/Fnr family transcriptional regulator [Pseudomonadales bacterium]
MNSQPVMAYLTSHEFFSGLDESYMKILSDSAQMLHIAEGDVLFKQGERAEKFYVLCDGKISVQVPAIIGPTLEIQTIGKDQLLGWSWLIPPYRWTFQAITEKDSELIEFDGATILQHCEQDPKFGYELMKHFTILMSERLDAARQRMIQEWYPAGFA